MINFLNISASLSYPRNLKGRLSTYHNELVAYVIDNFKSSRKFKQSVIDAFNSVSYHVIENDFIPQTWIQDYISGKYIVDEYTCKKVLNELFIEFKNIDWTQLDENSNTVQSSSNINTNDNVFNKQTTLSSTVSQSSIVDPTPKEDLYIRPPIVPQVNFDKIWMSGIVNNQKLCIYESCPIIPKKQCDISVTTDVNKLSNSELISLYPNRFIQTRFSSMYESIQNVPFDEKLGILIPIDGYSSEQIRDNIIKYPHIFQLKRLIDGQLVSFYKYIEINGELFNIMEVWNDLPESKIIPKESEFIKEYVVRRYLLERDISNIDHKYPLFGKLDPFLTLFTTSDDYISMGYTDIIDIAKQCVISRVSYKQSRNPVIRRIFNKDE